MTTKPPHEADKPEDDDDSTEENSSESDLTKVPDAFEAVQRALSEIQEAVTSAIPKFPSFTANLANAVRPAELSSRAIAEALKINVSIPPIKIPQVDPSVFSALTDAAKLQNALIEDLQASLAPMAEGLRRGFLPPNLRALVDEITATEMYAFVEEEAIPLYLIPRSRTALRLIHAQSRQDRRKVLNSCFLSIIEDCEHVVTTSRSELVSDQVKFVLDGIGAMRAGYVHSAQALFTVTLDTLITRLYPDRTTIHLVKRRKKDAVTPDEFDEMSIREALVWLPIWNAHEEFWPQNGDPVPRHFSRHASVHAVTSRQFNKRNCVQALMLVTSLIGYANDKW